MNNYAYLGVVRGGAFRPLAAEDGSEGSFRLTSVPPGASESPEDGEIALGRHADHALYVRGIARDGWILGASVVEEAGPILTMVVEAAFAAEARADPPTLTFPIG